MKEHLSLAIILLNLIILNNHLLAPNFAKQDINQNIFSKSESDSLQAKTLLRKALLIDKNITSSLAPEIKMSKLKKLETYLYQSIKQDPSQSLSPFLKSIAQQYFYTGIELFNKGIYPSSLFAFEKNIEILSREDVAELDTIVLFNAGIAAEKAEEYQKAEYYYQKLINYNYASWSVYSALAGLYKAQNNEKNFLKTIKEGIQNLPEENEPLINELLAYYLEKEQYKDALIIVDNRLIEDKFNPYWYYLKGSIYHQLKEENQAKIYYRKCLEKDPKHIDAAFNLSSILYNKSLDLSKEKKLDCKTKSQLKSNCTEAIKYLEIILRETPKDIDVLNMIQFCYHQLENKGKEQEISNRILKTYNE